MPALVDLDGRPLLAALEPGPAIDLAGVPIAVPVSIATASLVGLDAGRGRAAESDGRGDDENKLLQGWISIALLPHKRRGPQLRSIANDRSKREAYRHVRKVFI